MSFLAWSRTILSVYLLASCLPVFAVDPSRLLEHYSKRPKIEEIQAKEHNDLSSDWGKFKPAQFNLVAELLEFYPDYEIYFLARDSEFIYDSARLATLESESDRERVHLLNISRVNVSTSNIHAYLIQQGISPKAMARGKKILFVDTGFDGTISKAIKDILPEEARENFKTHLILSRNEEFPSSRVFLDVFQMPLEEDELFYLRKEMIKRYESLPKFTDRSFDYEEVNGQMEPVSHRLEGQEGDLQRITARWHMEDLKFYWSKQDSQSHFQKQRLLSREMFQFFQQASLSEEEISSKMQSWNQTFGQRSVALTLMDLDESIDKNINFPPKNHALVYKLAKRLSLKNLEIHVFQCKTVHLHYAI